MASLQRPFAAVSHLRKGRAKRFLDGLFSKSIYIKAVIKAFTNNKRGVGGVSFFDFENSADNFNKCIKKGM